MCLWESFQTILTCGAVTEGENPTLSVVAPSYRLAARTVKHQDKEVVNVCVHAPLCPLGPPTEGFVTSRHPALFSFFNLSVWTQCQQLSGEFLVSHTCSRPASLVLVGPSLFWCFSFLALNRFWVLDYSACWRPCRVTPSQGQPNKPLWISFIPLENPDNQSPGK